MKIEVYGVIPGMTGAGGWDARVRVNGVEGEITLLPDAYSGRPGAWGDLSNWMSASLIAYIDTLDKQTRSEVCGQIVHEARVAIIDGAVAEGVKS